MKKKMTVAANAFGAGSELIGKKCNNKLINNATRSKMYLEDGTILERKGNKVTYEADVPEHKICRKQKYDFNGYPID